MDSRIDELALIIVERCMAYKKQPGYDDRDETYRAVERSATDILMALDGYKDRHKEEY